MVFSWLLGTSDVLTALKKSTWKDILPPEWYNEWQSNHKLLSKKTKNILLDECKKKWINTFSKTSCWITSVLSLWADYNWHFARPEKYWCLDCVNRENCIWVTNEYEPARLENVFNILWTTGKISYNLNQWKCNLTSVCDKNCSSCDISAWVSLKLDWTFTLWEIWVARRLFWHTVTADKIINSNRLIFPEISINRVTWELVRKTFWKYISILK